MIEAGIRFDPLKYIGIYTDLDNKTISFYRIGTSGWDFVVGKEYKLTIY